MDMAVYRNQLPEQMQLKMAQSLIGTVLLGTFLGTAPHLAVAGGAIAALATLVEAAARPIIKEVFKGHDEIIWLSSVSVQVLALVSGKNACQALFGVTYRISFLLFSCVFTFILNSSHSGHPISDNRAIALIYA